MITGSTNPLLPGQKIIQQRLWFMSAILACLPDEFAMLYAIYPRLWHARKVTSQTEKTKRRTNDRTKYVYRHLCEEHH